MLLKFVLLPMFLTAVALIWIGLRVVRTGSENLRYKLVTVDGRFELRDYPLIAVAETRIGDGATAMAEGSRRLFRYFSGENSARQEIAITMPLFFIQHGRETTVALPLPQKPAPDGRPRPLEAGVNFEALDGGRYAAYRFSGSRGERNRRQAASRLHGWTERHSIRGLADPFFAYYDPPWTPAWLRRNEVLIRIP